MFTGHPSLLPALHPTGQTDKPVQLRRRGPPVTCTACAITFLVAPEVPAAVAGEPWVCARCTEGNA